MNDWNVWNVSGVSGMTGMSGKTGKTGMSGKTGMPLEGPAAGMPGMSLEHTDVFLEDLLVFYV